MLKRDSTGLERQWNNVTEHVSETDRSRMENKSHAMPRRTAPRGGTPVPLLAEVVPFRKRKKRKRHVSSRSSNVIKNNLLTNRIRVWQEKVSLSIFFLLVLLYEIFVIKIRYYPWSFALWSFIVGLLWHFCFFDSNIASFFFVQAYSKKKLLLIIHRTGCIITSIDFYRSIFRLSSIISRLSLNISTIYFYYVLP